MNRSSEIREPRLSPGFRDSTSRLWPVRTVAVGFAGVLYEVRQLTSGPRLWTVLLRIVVEFCQTLFL